MKALKIILFTFVLAAGLFTAWLFIPLPTTLEGQTLEKPLAEPFKLVAYRSNPNDSAKPITYHYYIISDVTKIEDEEPFLITTDQFVSLEHFGESTFSLSLNGKIEQYKNDVWVKKANGQYHHWYASIDASYVR